MQIERYRQMTGEERLKIGCQLTDAWLERLTQQIRLEFPNASPDEFKALLRARIVRDKTADRLQAFKQLQSRWQLTPEKAAAWPSSVREGRR